MEPDGRVLRKMEAVEIKQKFTKRPHEVIRCGKNLGAGLARR
jgi:hypothetical protein